MQTYFPCRQIKTLVLDGLLCAVVMATFCGATGAQTLARPGWVGSGLTSQPWWHDAVLYRVAPRAFQDSNADGTGDLRGLAQRMDYIQSLGVDAVVLDPPDVSDANSDGFDDLLTAASQHHVRVLVTLEDTDGTQQDNLLAQARLWLTRGVAGILLHSAQPAGNAAPLLRRLRALTDSFPGGRVLVAETATNPAPSTLRAIDLDAGPAPARNTNPGRQAAGAQMTGVLIELTNATAKTVRAALTGVNTAADPSQFYLSEGLFSTKEILAPENLASLDGRRRAFALVLLATRGGAALRYGQEIGELPTENRTGPQELMRWTPTNVTPAPKPEAKPDLSAKPTVAGPSDVYGTFKPYVPPPKSPPAAAAGEPASVPVPVDPASERGFTDATFAGKLPGALSPDAAKLNVAVEDVEPESLLNMYRRLVQLHHDNPSLRDGPELLLDYDDLGAVVWVREPPRGSSTSSTIVAVCNLSGAPLHLSLNAELTRQHIHTGSLRNLLSTKASRDSVQSTGDLSLPAYGVFLGELYH